MMSDKNTTRVICGAMCIALTLIGFHYDSGWAFIGAVIAFCGVMD